MSSPPASTDKRLRKRVSLEETPSRSCHAAWPSPAPFPAGPSVAAYVVNSEFEQGLQYLSARLLEKPCWAAISGAPGVGKTLLARLLLDRLGRDFTPVYAPSALGGVEGLARWTAEQAGADPSTSLEQLARGLAAAGRPLLLAIDEAHLAPTALLERVAALCTAELEVRSVSVWCDLDDRHTPRLLSRAPARIIVDPLVLARIPDYVASQLAHVGAPDEVKRLLSGPTLERLALASGGNPRQIQRIADAEILAWLWRSAERAAVLERAEPESAERAHEPAAPTPVTEVVETREARLTWGPIACIATLTVVLLAWFLF